MDSREPHQAPAPTPDTPPNARRWPRRIAIAAAVTGTLAVGAFWYLGRETTLQMVAQRIASATDGKLTLEGVSGSLYGAMHVERLVWRTDEQLVEARKIDLRWSPAQVLSGGILIDQLWAQDVRMQTLKASTDPTTLPESLAPPFRVELDDAKLKRMTVVGIDGGSTRIDDIHLQVKGDKHSWVVRQAQAATPWGQVAASGNIGAQRPFKLNLNASLTQSQASAGARPAQLKLKAGGDLQHLATLNASGQAGRAQGTAQLALAPFADIPLRTLRLQATNLDPGFFNPALPTADMQLGLDVQLDAQRNIKGKVDIRNDGAIGTIDQQRLPLRVARGQLGGNLDALEVADVLLDFGDAGQFVGTGNVARGKDEDGIGTARFALRTERFNLRHIHSSLKPTAIKGEIALINEAERQTVQTNLVDAGLRLEALATLEGQLATLKQARLTAGRGSITASGTMALDGDQRFEAKAQASRFDPAAFGELPGADINATINATGALAPAWQVAADFSIAPSRLLQQPLSGKGKLKADAKRLSDIDINLALGQNSARINGAFGTLDDRLQWRVEGRQLSALQSELYGALQAQGVASGTMQAPRTTFELDANNLGMNPTRRQADNGLLRASGEAWLAGEGDAQVPAFKVAGNTQRFNPAAFGSPLAGTINAAFTAQGQAGANWRAALDLKVADSLLGSAPFTGHARLNADRNRFSQTDIDLRAGSNQITASGSFGAARDKLDWRIDAPQLGLLGSEFGGSLVGNGSLSGSYDTPSLAANLSGQQLRAPGGLTLRSLQAKLELGAGKGASDALVTAVELRDYVNGDTRLNSASLTSEGTRGNHTLRLAAVGEGFDANTEVQGGFARDTWSGTLAALQNRGRYALALQKPVPLSISGAAGSGVAGLASPQKIDFNGAVITLPAGSLSIDTLSKNGPRWSSRGHADNVPLTYLAQFSQGMRDSLRGDLTLGANWSVDMRAPQAPGAAPSVDGNVRVFREKGDAIVGGNTPVPLGLRQFEARADVVGSSLRVNLDIDGTRTGKTQVEANSQLLAGKLAPDSPLRVTANADMPSIAWLAALAGEPGLELDGALKLALTGSGTIGTPSLNGNIEGNKLAVRWAEQGVRLQNGDLRAQFTGDQLRVERLTFQGREGSAAASGFVRFGGNVPGAELNLTLDKLEALSRPDRTVVLSGKASLVRDATRFALEGNLKADRALIEFAPAGSPTMSDDVIVLGREQAVAPAAKEKEIPLTVDLRADLGEAFKLRAMGIDATLAGTARVRMVGAGQPRINGTIRATEGTYAAYGQRLTIEKAILTFSGPYDNPSLDILAVRKRPEGEQLSENNVEAGVSVRGTAQAPQAKLVSTPSVSDSDKLAWLVLGHGMDVASGNQKDVLTAAAGALLSGGGGSGGLQARLASSLGVDELGLKQGAGGEATGLENTVVTVGKRISKRAYISFEQGTSTASSLVRLRYTLTPRISLQFQTGTNSALDILYSWAFD